MVEVFDLEDTKRKMLRKYPFFGSTISTVKYEIVGDGHPVTTAATDGETIFVNEKFVSELPEDEQIFVFAHEVCHIALKHIPRSKERDEKLWNIATDGVINQHLKKDGLTMPKGCVDIDGALAYDAEELYNVLLEAKKNEQANKQGGQSQEQGEGQQGDSQNEQQSGNIDNVGHDDHSMWKEAVKKAEEDAQKENGKQSEGDQKENAEEEKGLQNAEEKEETQNGEEKKDASDSKEISEKNAFEKNEEEKIRRAEEVMKKINSTRRGMGGNSQEAYVGEVGKASKPVADWKKLLIRTLEIEDEVWGHKFSDKSNGYAARIEDAEFDEDAETEIILDTSGSVSVGLLKSFLRQVKTLLKNSKIKVGTFSDKFHGFVEIKKEAEIDSLKIKVGGGTNFDAASKAFSKRKDVNKICFTDGQDCGNAGIKEKRKDIVWVSFENPHFKPDDGKVIFVPKDKIQLTDDEPERK